jgi:hypothetical protein
MNKKTTKALKVERSQSGRGAILDVQQDDGLNASLIQLGKRPINIGGLEGDVM